MDDNVLLRALETSRLVALVNVDDPRVAMEVAQAMVKGGIRCIEVMFRNANAAEGLAAIASEVEAMTTGVHVGAGTIRSVDQARQAVGSGATFIVLPGFNEAVVAWARDEGVPVLPGVDSTLGIELAALHGLSAVKFFPAVESGGIAWLRAVAGPYPEISFIPTGGILLANMVEYLRLPNVVALGGSFLAPKAVIARKDYDEITRTCRAAVEIATQSRP